MHYSRRVAAWLYGLILGLIPKCVYFDKLEMISFWLLCLKLLRATAGVKKTTGNALSDGSGHTLSPKQKEQEYFSEAVAMETTPLSEMATSVDYKMDSMETETAANKDVLCEDGEVSCQEDFSECTKTDEGSEPPEGPLRGEIDVHEYDGKENTNDCRRLADPGPCQQEALVLETGQGELYRTESTTSSVSDTNSSTGSVCENELACKKQDLADQEGQDDTVLTEEIEDRQLTVTVDHKAQDVKQKLEEQSILENLSQQDKEESIMETLRQQETEESFMEDLSQKETEESILENLSQQNTVESILENLSQQNTEESILENLSQPNTEDSILENLSQKNTEEPMLENLGQQNREESILEILSQQNTEESILENPSQQNTEESIFENLSQPETEESIFENHCQQETEDSILEQCVRVEALSDISTESGHDLDRDDLSDCLQVEIANISSDSETDEKWRAIFSSSFKKEDGEDIYFENSHEANFQELSDPVESKTEPNLGSEEDTILLEQPAEYPDSTQDRPCHLSTQFHSLSKICEDEEESGLALGPGPCVSPPVKADPDKRVPSDYCVIQETKSENVSTEHVDFRVARKQWLKMEEQTKQQVHKQPVISKGKCQGGHSLMYTPVRNIDRTKKELEPDTLGLSEYAFTQFSPCSEDSGLDDSSYRSPYDDPETPIEREIRLELEREESLRRERGLSRPPGECAQGSVRPVSLLPGKYDRGPGQGIEDKRRAADNGQMQDNSGRLPRSPTGRMPSFSIPSTSPSSKGPLYHEMAANNVIILEPEPGPVSPRQFAKVPLSSPVNTRFSEWPSDTTSVIILETSNLIIRSASEFCLNTICQETQDSTFLNNPFFKLRSRSSQSLVDQEIKMVKQREEELKRQRARLYTKEKYDTVLVSPNLMDSLCFDKSEMPVKCKSSPSSPMKTARKMDRSTLSCEHKFPDTFSGVRRKSAMAMRWEAGQFANHQQD